MRDFIPRKIDINGDIDAVNVKQFDNDSRYIHVTISDEDLSDGTFDLLGCSAALYIQPTIRLTFHSSQGKSPTRRTALSHSCSRAA